MPHCLDNIAPLFSLDALPTCKFQLTPIYFGYTFNFRLKPPQHV